MILTALKRKIRRWACPGCDKLEHLPGSERLVRAERLHAISTLAVANEAEKQIKRVSDMRIAASAAVKRLNHEKREIEGRAGGAV